MLMRSMTTFTTLTLLLLTGCVERRMYITSRPAGAEVYIDGEYAGQTPLRLPFSHYGTHDVTFRETQHVSVIKKWTLSPPFYQWFPIDLFTEWLLPVTLVDQQRLDVEMEQTPPITTDVLNDLKERAETLRRDGRKTPADN